MIGKITSASRLSLRSSTGPRREGQAALAHLSGATNHIIRYLKIPFKIRFFPNHEPNLYFKMTCIKTQI